MFENVYRRSAATVVAFLISLTCAQAATINLTSDTVERAGDTGTICVNLVTRGGERVAGTENLLVWDGDCATILDGTCEANPAHGKNLSGVVQQQRDFTYKGLVLSLTDTDPMPAGELYCCDFVAAADPGGCCRIRIGSPGGSDPEGNSLSVGAGNPGQLCVASDGNSNRGGSSDDVFDSGGLAGRGGGTSGGGSAPAGGGGSSGGGVVSGFGGDVPAGQPAGIVADLGGQDQDRFEQPNVEPAQRAQPASKAPVAENASSLAKLAKAKNLAKLAKAKQLAKARNAKDAARAKSEDGAEPPPGSKEEKEPAAATAQDEPATDESEPSQADTKPQAVIGSKSKAGADTEKPSPRDVKRAQRAGSSTRDRRMPLDDEEGWFGCNIAAPDRSAASLVLALPALLLLLRRGRRRI